MSQTPGPLEIIDRVTRIAEKNPDGVLLSKEDREALEWLKTVRRRADAVLWFMSFIGRGRWLVVLFLVSLSQLDRIEKSAKALFQIWREPW